MKIPKIINSILSQDDCIIIEKPPIKSELIKNPKKKRRKKKKSLKNSIKIQNPQNSQITDLTETNTKNEPKINRPKKRKKKRERQKKRKKKDTNTLNTQSVEKLSKEELQKREETDQRLKKMLLYYSRKKNRIFDKKNILSCVHCHSVDHNSVRCEDIPIPIKCLMCGDDGSWRKHNRKILNICKKCTQIKLPKKHLNAICLFCSKTNHQINEKCTEESINEIKSLTRCLECNETGHVTCFTSLTKSSKFCCNCGSAEHLFQDCLQNKMNESQIRLGMGLRRAFVRRGRGRFRGAISRYKRDYRRR